MKLHELKAVEGSTKARKRIGHGPGSGTGKTSGKGEKGQNARSGGGVRPGFEGGQLPLYRRIPSRGFNNKDFEKKYSTVNVEKLNAFEAGSVVDACALLEKGILSKIEKDGVKILGNGELKVALTVKASKFTASAVEKIKALGGNTEEV